MIFRFKEYSWDNITYIPATRSWEIGQTWSDERWATVVKKKNNSFIVSVIHNNCHVFFTVLQFLVGVSTWVSPSTDWTTKTASEDCCMTPGHQIDQNEKEKWMSCMAGKCCFISLYPMTLRERWLANTGRKKYSPDVSEESSFYRSVQEDIQRCSQAVDVLVLGVESQ